MASEFKKKAPSRRTGAAVVNTPGVKPPSTVEIERVPSLPRTPEKWPATIVPPPANSSAEKPPTAAAAPSGPYVPAEEEERPAPAVAPAPSVSPAKAAEIPFTAPETDPEAALRYQSALEALERKTGEAPQYESRYEEEIRRLYEQLTGRRPFRYDSTTDPLYQQYAQGYIEQGAQAMRDTMGRAAALTGGYGSSYAQSVGQQQYDAYLRRLADVLPETYGMALEAYQAEGDELQRRYNLAAGLEKSDYERYLDSLGQYNREVAQARDDVTDALEQMRYGEETAYRRAVDEYERRLAADKLEYSRRQDAYARLVRLLAAGYTPSAEEYAEAGMSPAQGEALLAPAESEPTVIVRKAEKGEGGIKSQKTKKTVSKRGRIPAASLKNK